MADAKKYHVKLVSMSPLLMHADNIADQDDLIAWREIPENKVTLVKGDDRTPGWAWTTKLCHDRNNVGIPVTYISAVLRDAGKKLSFPGNAKENFKRYTQSGMSILVDGGYLLPLRFGSNFKKRLTMKDVEALQKVYDFSEQLRLVEKLGFTLYVNRVPVGNGAKHVRVRPHFDPWETEFDLEVHDEDASLLKLPVLEHLFRVAGNQIGLGDWRPSAPFTPGSFGTFQAFIEPIVPKATRSRK